MVKPKPLPPTKTLSATGRTIANKLKLKPNARADSSAKQILRSFVNSMELNTPCVIADIDPECVHDLRVAVRRTRTLLGQLPETFPKKRIHSAKNYFARLGSITTPLRDLDVMLLNFEDYRKLLPTDKRQDLDKVYQTIAQQRTAAYNRVKKHLQSKRHQAYLNNWKEFLESDVPANTSLNNAKRPIKKIADERIWKAYQKVIKQGSKIKDNSPADTLHSLRKNGKKLRYLLEFFQSLYPSKKIKLAIKSLKTLQNQLGEYQDLHVHIEFFDELKDLMQKDQLVDDKTTAALAQIKKTLGKKQLQCRRQFQARFNQFNSKSHRGEFKALFF